MRSIKRQVDNFTFVVLVALTLQMFGLSTVMAAVQGTQPTIAILDEGDAGDGFINRLEAEGVVVSGNTSLITKGRTVDVLFSIVGEGVAIAARTTVDDTGHWTTPATNILPLSDGVLEITANVETKEGVPAGEARNTVNLITSMPQVTVNFEARTANQQPIFHGTTDQPDGTTVNVTLDLNGLLLCDATVEESFWRCRSILLEENQYRAAARVTDLAGNIGSAPFVFEIDSDLDDDGISDVVEGTGDVDGDLIPNNLDLDSDGDGLPDALEGTSDNDRDGRPNYLDIDSDNDGIVDGTEVNSSGSDSDSDGIDDAFDFDINRGVDLNFNAISDHVEALPDTDNDGVPDIFDLDSDNDTLTDVIEAGGFDLDQDGFLDSGYPPIIIPPNSDFEISGDLIPDFRDLDSNDDGVTDLVSSGQFIDLDDGFGKVLNGPDTDADGIINAVDRADLTYGTVADTDLDGIYNDIDLDDDNDGLVDTVEGEESDDFDGDGIPNRLDLDSDNDSIPDGLEGFYDNHPPLSLNSRIQSPVDANRDGLHDLIDPSWIPVDSDGDLSPDFLDIDSDNDGLFDLYEADVVQADQLDQDDDGRVDALIDEDRDGLMDVVDQSIAAFEPKTKQTFKLKYPDFDQDGVRDFRDADSDNDGFGDAVERGDFNSDGYNDWLQNEGSLDTAVTGYGAVDGWLILLFIAAIIGRFSGLNSLKHLKQILNKLSPKFLYNLPQKKGPKKEQRRGKKIISNLSDFKCFKLFALFALLIGFGHTSDSFAFKLCENNTLECTYVGFSLGFSEIDPEGTANGWQTNDDSQTGWSIYAGVPLSSHWFGEVTYGDLGAAQLRNLNPNVVNSEEVGYNVFAAHLGYSLWADARPHNFFAKFGLAKLDNDSSSNSIQLNNVSQIQLSGSAGWLWKPLRQHWFLRAHYDIYDRDAHFLGLSLGYDFMAKQVKRTNNIVSTTKHTHTVDSTSEKSLVTVISTEKTAQQVAVTPPMVKAKPIKPIATIQANSVVEFVSQVQKQKTCRIFEGALQGVRFENNSSTLTANARDTLNKTIETLKRVPELIVEIQAYTDNQGSEMYNQWLSERRAAAVLSYLTDNGLSGYHFKAKGFGESFPVASNSSELNRALNRRVQFQLINEQACQ